MRPSGEFCFERSIPGADICRFGGGGGAAAQVSQYTSYLAAAHAQALGGAPPGFTLGGFVTSMVYQNPFTGRLTYNPDANLAEMSADNDTYRAYVNALVEYTYWPTLLSLSKTSVDLYVYDNASADAAALEFGVQVDADITNVALPRFKRSMQTINAVCSSAFAVGQSVIEAEAARNKNKFKADLYLQNYKERTQAIPAGVDAMLKMMVMKNDSYAKFSTASLEENRQAIIAKVDQADKQMRIKEMEIRWPFELYVYWGNLMAANAGGVSKTGSESGGGGSGLSAAMSGIGSILSIVASIWG